MTSHTEQSIKLADIAGLRLQCRNEDCDTSLLIGLDNENHDLSSLLATNNNVLTMCPGCGYPWMAEVQMTLDSEIKKLVRQINDLRALEDKFGCSLTFEIKHRSIFELHRRTERLDRPRAWRGGNAP
jgi:hypothetical protein